MSRIKGTVKNGVIVLAEGSQLPEGEEVEIRIRKKQRSSREEAFQRVLRSRIHHPVGIDAIIEEDKKEREERWQAFWDGNGQ